MALCSPTLEKGRSSKPVITKQPDSYCNVTNMQEVPERFFREKNSPCGPVPKILTEWGGQVGKVRGGAAALHNMHFILDPVLQPSLCSSISAFPQTTPTHWYPGSQPRAWPGASLQLCPKAHKFVTSGNLHIREPVLRLATTFHFHDFLSVFSVYCRTLKSWWLCSNSLS